MSTTSHTKKSSVPKVHVQQATSKPLTPREKSVLEFLETYAQLHGYAPTYQEICNHFGFASFNSAQRYLKQLEAKDYISLGGANQKRAISLLQSASTYQEGAIANITGTAAGHTSNNTSAAQGSAAQGSAVEGNSAEGHSSEVSAIQVPMLGRVAAGAPLEAYDSDEFVDVPLSLMRKPDRTFALRVQGQSMIDDGIFDGDVILVERQSQAENGKIVVAVIKGEHGPEEATVKRVFLDNSPPSEKAHSTESQLKRDKLGRGKPNQGKPDRGKRNLIELRPSNSAMESMWYPVGDVQIRGIVVGLIRTF